MDYDGDGHDDLISGSYDPGTFHLFRGLGKGKFAARETLMDRAGKTVLTNPEVAEAVGSFGSWVAMVDWDDDEDLDLVLGSFEGQVKVRLNEGTRTAPVWAAGNVTVQADGEDILVPGHHFTPVIADWDDDGLWDLLSGSDEGSVWWYRNIGVLGDPKFMPGQMLVTAPEGFGYDEWVEDGQLDPGIRSQIAVSDWNGDGRLDLLVGDFRTAICPKKDLGAEDTARLRRIHEKMGTLNSRIYDAEDEERALRGKKDALDEARAARSRLIALEAESKKLMELARPLMSDGDGMRLGANLSRSYGFVWLYLRR